MKITPAVIMLIIMLMGLDLTGGAKADDPFLPELPALSEQDAFALVFQNPADPDLNIQLAQIQIRLGRNKAAIATLERIVIFDPDHVEARGLLMRLNLAIGNVVDARLHAETLAVNPNADAAQIHDAKAVMEMLEKRNEALSVSGYLVIGGGINDNPAGGSKGNLARIGNTIGQLDKPADSEAFVISTTALNMRLRLPYQRQTDLGLSLIGHIREYSHYDDGDINALSMAATYSRAFRHVQAHSQIYASRIVLDGHPYLNSYSAEIALAHHLADNISGVVIGQVNRRIYKNRSQPNASIRSGNRYHMRYQITRTFPSVQISGGVEAGFTDASAAWSRAAERGVSSEITTDIFPGLLSLSTHYSTADHAHTNPSHGDIRRHDIIRQMTIKHRIGLTGWSVPQQNEPSLTISIGATNQTSNIENYSRNSGEISLVLTRYF
ncbi:tetratricopeptide repeat protein [Alphaproteobacteria bacterium]|nr:tetratricopeptide repeat protein [Alphaproteobacteria bacterium]